MMFDKSIPKHNNTYWNNFNSTFNNSPYKKLTIPHSQSNPTSEFSIERFISRYLCGDEALKSLRKVSRTRLYLADINIKKDDTEAYLLKRSIHRYQRAMHDFLCHQTISINTLLQVHKTLLGSQANAGKIVTAQNWIGKTPQQATYVGAPLPQVKQQLSLLVDFLNSQDKSNIYTLLSAAVWLTSIHPFQDGNGRTARVMYHALASLNDSTHIPIELYRLMANRTDFKHALLLFGATGNKGPHHAYWQAAINWSTHFQTTLLKQLATVKNTLNNKLTLQSLNELDQGILAHLWHFPVTNISTISSQLNASPVHIVPSLEKLLHLRVIQTFKVRDPKNPQVFVWFDLIECLNEIDELVLSTT